MVYFLWERHIITSLEMFGFYSCVHLSSFLISRNLMVSQEENKIQHYLIQRISAHSEVRMSLWRPDLQHPQFHGHYESHEVNLLSTSLNDVNPEDLLL